MSSNNPILLAAKPRHRNSRTTEKDCEVLLLPGCWDSLKDSLTDPVTCKPSTQGLYSDTALQPVGKGLSRKCMEVDRLMRLRSGSRAWSTGHCSPSWPAVQTCWKSNRAQTPHGRVRNFYDLFSSFVLFHLDLNNSIWRSFIGLTWILGNDNGSKSCSKSILHSLLLRHHTCRLTPYFNAIVYAPAIHLILLHSPPYGTNVIFEFITNIPYIYSLSGQISTVSRQEFHPLM